ncbi:MAG: DNA-formamidopyrimidine glycosylase family protein [Acidimicrobiales bacterium]
MPELPEIEEYRQLAEHALGRQIRDVVIGDLRYLRGATTPRLLRRVLRANAFTVARRHGKLLVLELAEGPHRLGLRFGMTGRLRVDDVVAAEDLVYASRRQLKSWDRFGVRFADGGRMVVGDARLLGGVSLDPDESALGPDALTITLAQLRAALDDSAVALKARLMDQSRVAGIGNLIADELLWRASLSPVRRAGSLSIAEHRRLHHHLRRTLALLIERGGSHTGDLMPERAPGGRCPRDGAELRRSVVGGRTTWWCARHQR